MHIVFGKVLARSPETYVRQKLEAWIAATHPAEHRFEPNLFQKLTNHVLADGLNTTVPAAEADSFYEISRRQSREIEARKRCMIATVVRESPRLAGEEILDDFPTFLLNDWDNLPRNTALLRRRTNFAELYYVFDDVQVVQGDVVFVSRPPSPVEPFVPQVMMQVAEIFSLAVIITQLGTGIVSGIGGKIGALIFDSVFPPAVPSYFEQVYQQIREIVHQEITQGTIDRINGNITGIIKWVKNTYVPLKRNKKTSRKDLHKALEPKQDTMSTQVLGPLMTEPYKKPGFSVFMVAAGMDLALTQEQALTDLHHDNPCNSSCAASAQLKAEEYRNHGVKVFKDIMDTRLDRIKLEYDPDIICSGARCWPKDAYRWFDKQTKTRGALHRQYTEDKKSHNGSEQAEADRQNRIAQVRAELTAALGNPEDVANKWLQLKDNPIPRVVAATGQS